MQGRVVGTIIIITFPASIFHLAPTSCSNFHIFSTKFFSVKSKPKHLDPKWHRTSHPTLHLKGKKCRSCRWSARFSFALKIFAPFGARFMASVVNSIWFSSKNDLTAISANSTPTTVCPLSASHRRSTDLPHFGTKTGGLSCPKSSL